jgi:protein O-mannosyl-transferase
MNAFLKRKLVICVLLAAMTAIAFWQVGRHQFVNYDDHCYVTENRQVQAGLTWDGLAWAFFRLNGERTYWHPLTWVSHMMDCQLFGLNPAGHHLVNLLFHMLNVVLVFLVFYRLTKAYWHCAVLAALFALHPLQVDTVAWVAERKNLLSAAFWLLTMWAYAHYVEVQSLKSKVQSPTPYDGGARSLFHLPSSIFYLLTLFFFALGLMCKPVLVTLPFVLLLLDYWPLKRFQLGAFKPTALALARLTLEKTPFFLLTGVSCLITIAGHRALGSLDSTSQSPLPLRAANAVVSYARYIGKTLWPTHLSVLYPYPRAWPGWKVALCGLLILGVSALVIRMVRTRPYLFVGWFWFLGVLTPFIGLVQAGEQAMADRFMYLPLLGLLLMIVWSLGELLEPWPARHRWLAAAGALGLGACLVCTSIQLTHWQNSETLFRHAVAVTSGSDTAYAGLGGALFAAGKREEALACYKEAVRLNPRYAEGECSLGALLLTMGRLDEAIQHLNAALKLNPALAIARNDLGTALLDQGKSEEALTCYTEAVRLQPRRPESQFNLGALLLKMGHTGEAVQHLAAAVQYNPSLTNAHIYLGKALFEQGKLAEAGVHLYKAVQLAPDDPEARYNLGTLLSRQGKVDLAIICYREALRLNPEYGLAHGNLGVALMRQGKSDEGLAHLVTAARLNPNDASAHDNLGLAYMELNRFVEAADQFSEVLRLKPEAAEPHHHLALALFRQGKPKEALRYAQKAHDLAVAAGQAALAANAEELLKKLQ